MSSSLQWGASRTATAFSYQHTRLQQLNSIRVLHLAPGQKDDRLRCSLHEVSLDNTNGKYSYEALSYYSGSTNGTLEILVDGKGLLVTENCAKAMYSLRYKWKTRILWIDAICIDHSEDIISERERCRQVVIMGNIYARAKQVVVWLDVPDDVMSARTMKQLQRVAFISKTYFLYFGRFESSKRVLRSIMNLYWANPERHFGISPSP
jgi:Heterokaryon incompatibility protein (HET)